MKLSALEYFIALAESQSINKAAQKLYISQPSLTKSLQSLEEELGVQLFYRDKQGITLTEAGETILPEARQVVKLCNGWKSLAGHDSVRQIDVYTQSIFSYFLLPDVLLRVRKDYPDLTIELASMLKPGQYISRDVHRPVLCLFVCSEEQMRSFAEIQGNEPLILLKGEYHCLMNPASPLAGQKDIDLSELREHYFAMGHIKGLYGGDSYGVLFSTFQELFRQVPRQNFIEAGSLANAVTMVQRNPEVYTFAFYPMLEYWNAASPHQVIHRPIRGQDTRGLLCLFYDKQAYRQHPAVQDIVKGLKQAVLEIPGRASPSAKIT